MTSMVLTLLMLLLLFVNPSTAFTSLQQPHSIIKEPRKRRPANIFQRHATTSITSPEKSYGETSRKFRRTFFTHKDWLRHREDDRLVRRIIGIFKSGIVRQLAKDVGYVVAMATVVDAALPRGPSSQRPRSSSTALVSASTTLPAAASSSAAATPRAAS